MRLYAYYSCGGYKDMFLGELSSNSGPVYYLPLLPIIKKRNQQDDIGLIRYLEALPQIKIITNSNPLGFPLQCNSLFSHGAYNILYRTLANGEYVLAIRGIESSIKDEEGRSTPFNLLFVTDCKYDVAYLDSTAYYCTLNYNNLNNELSNTIIYDTTVNGLRADIHNVWSWIVMCKTNWNHEYRHKINEIIILMIASESMLDLFIKEHNVDCEKIDHVIDVNGNIIAKNIDPIRNNHMPDMHNCDDIESEIKQLGKDLSIDKALKKIKNLIDSVTK